MKQGLPALLATVACGCGSTVARVEAERGAFASRVEILVRDKDIEGLLAIHYPEGMTQELREMARTGFAWLDDVGKFDSLRVDLTPIPSPLPSAFETAGRKVRFNAFPVGMVLVEYAEERDDGARLHGVGTILYSVVNGRYYIVGYEYE